MLADDLDKILKEIDASARPYLQLPDFERFAFVMTVLEGYTVRDCAALLDSTSLAVEQARTRGLEAVAAGQLPLMTAHAGSSGSKRGSVLVID
jgi:DNA-directed RNA polymerase specialized sigma24 family protein